jgi:hypothetical protein
MLTFIYVDFDNQIMTNFKSRFSQTKQMYSRASKVLYDGYKHVGETEAPDSMKENAKDEMGSIREAERLFHVADNKFDDESWYDVYRVLSCIKDLIGGKKKALEKLNNKKRNQMTEDLADFIMDELWDNSRKGLNFRTEITEEKALNQAEKLLSGEKEVMTYRENKETFGQARGERKELHRSSVLKYANKKDYFEDIEHPEIWKFETEKIISVEKQVAEELKELAEEAKKRSAQIGKRKLQDRPVILIREEDMQEANRRVRERGLGKDGVEIKGAFKREKVGEREILLHNYFNVESEDRRMRGTKPNDAYRMGLGTPDEESIIDFHSHIEKDLGYAKEDQFSSIFGDMGFLEEHNEGIGVVAVPWSMRDSPKEKVVWFAETIRKEQGKDKPSPGGKLKIHIVNENEGKIDSRYDWPEIYNDRLNHTFSSSLGPYWIHQVEMRENLWDPRESF